MNKTKIAILGSRGIPARYGGFETFAERVSVGLSTHGFDVTVFCPSGPNNRRVYKGVKLCYVPNLEKFFGEIGTLFYDLLSLLKVSLSDFKIVYMLGYGASFFCAIPKMFGKQIVINTDGLEWKRSKWGKLAKKYLNLSERVAVRVADCLVSDSLAIKDYYKKTYNRDSVFITNGADLYYPKKQEILKEFDLVPGGYYLVVARLEPENNIHTIIQGFSMCKTTKKLFLITSFKKTEYFEKIKKLCKKDKRIVLYGPLYDKEKLNEVRANAFAYIHGHSVGGTNPSLLESMACGNVVLAIDVEFNREVIRGNGFFFKTADELKSAIERVEALESDKRNSMSLKVREIIRRYYNWDSIVEEHKKLFLVL